LYFFAAMSAQAVINLFGRLQRDKTYDGTLTDGLRFLVETQTGAEVLIKSHLRKKGSLQFRWRMKS
jgi:hypothetical protein